MTGIDIKEFTVHSSQFTVLRILKQAEEEIRVSGVPNPRLDAEALLSRALDIDRVGLYTQYERILSEEEVNNFFGLVKRRNKREPLQYILGNTEFFGLGFIVTPDVLIPRPETELLVEEALKQFTAYGSQFTVLDLCTGSGCIAVTLAKKLEGVRIYGVDISARALRVAKENARRHRVEGKINFIQGDLFEPFTVHGSRFTVHGCRFNLIVSNPPYIPSSEIDFLQEEVKDYEPREALDGGNNGLSFLKRIIKEAPDYLKAGGSLLLEIGYGQKERVYEIAEEREIYQTHKVIKDFAGIERVVKLNIR
ncbi:MAG: peptide chain release factor N(5)-glutamine methyltransferase [Nitrospirae bacterium]|nr:peptide chain release factor N(5)-glutamine methyltransferase [Nitrospirota bacterium]